VRGVVRDVVVAPLDVWPLLAGYLIVIFGLREWMRNRDAFVLKSIARVHNFILCTGSLAITATCLFEIGRFYFVEGYTVRDLFCDNVNGVTGAMTTGRLGVVAWAYYASKYYELLDTVLMVRWLDGGAGTACGIVCLACMCG